MDNFEKRFAEMEVEIRALKLQQTIMRKEIKSLIDFRYHQSLFNDTIIDFVNQSNDGAQK